MVSLSIVNWVSGPSQFTNLRILLCNNQKARSEVLENKDWAWMIEDGERGGRRRTEQLELGRWLWMLCWNGGLRSLAWRKWTLGCVHSRDRWCTEGAPNTQVPWTTQTWVISREFPDPHFPLCYFSKLMPLRADPGCPASSYFPPHLWPLLFSVAKSCLTLCNLNGLQITSLPCPSL